MVQVEACNEKLAAEIKRMATQAQLPISNGKKNEDKLLEYNYKKL
jgi:hypothetical protein